MLASSIQKVLVTGGTGFLGSHLVKLLLEEGYHVNATTTNLKDAKKIKVLETLKQKYADELELFEVNMMDKDGFLEAMQGVDCIFHTANPVLFEQKMSAELADEKQIKPTIQGMKNLLSTVLKVSSVQTIIHTSTIFTIFSYLSKSTYFDETSYNTQDTIETDTYVYSKIMAEKLLYQFEKDHGDKYRVVTIHPTLVVGPQLHSNEINLNDKAGNFGVKTLEYILNGGMKLIPNETISLVDVRDVALMHLLACTNTDATGRFICSTSPMLFQNFINILYKKTLNPNLPTQLGDKGRAKCEISHEKSIKVLNMIYSPIEKSISETLDQIINL